MEKIMKEIFVSKDGKEFVNQKDCENYERNVLSLKSKIKYFQCYCEPDLTEGRGWYCNIYFAVLDDDYCHLERAVKYLVDKYKSPIEYVMGVSPIKNWSIPIKCTEQDFIKAEKPKVGDYYHTSKQIFISKTKIDGLPNPIWVQ